MSNPSVSQVAGKTYNMYNINSSCVIVLNDVFGSKGYIKDKQWVTACQALAA